MGDGNRERLRLWRLGRVQGVRSGQTTELTTTRAHPSPSRMDPSATEEKDETKQARVAVAPLDAQDDSDDDHREEEVADDDDEDMLNDWPDDTQVGGHSQREKRV